jgi:hypothetical protein
VTRDEQQRLLARAGVGDLTPEEASRLLEACRRDPELLAQLSRLTVVDRLLAHGHLYPDDGSFLREVRVRLQVARLDSPAAPSVSARARQSYAKAWVWAAAAALVLGVTTWLALRSRQPEAQIVRIESATWAAGQAPLRIGDPIDDRRLRLAAGFVELKFAHGATVIVEGPANFEVRGPQRAFLHQGRAVTRLPKGTKGFILDSPRGRLVDQGTEFGVTVGPSGDTEVHVLEGKVEAVPNNHQHALQLSVNQAARLTPERVEQFTADAVGFITDLPPANEGEIGYLHWSLDEGAGGLSHNRGAGLGLPGARALLRAHPETSPGPQWIAGQFGAGLSFDGRHGFVECEFPGIAGSEPRTVAFWVKVPRDSTIEEGYGIVNWGVQQPGLAWQISVNPAAHEGPLGRLRLGVNQGYVVGTTDLRDDRWHHCAVVMYGGHRPDSATHILLYLDGELEPAARKAVREIRTDITGTAAHNMWLGRNLSYQDSAPPNGLGRFFRGSVDEIFVFNASLNQEQIRSLMKYNRLTPTKPVTPPQGQ